MRLFGPSVCMVPVCLLYTYRALLALPLLLYRSVPYLHMFMISSSSQMSRYLRPGTFSSSDSSHPSSIGLHLIQKKGPAGTSPSGRIATWQYVWITHLHPSYTNSSSGLLSCLQIQNLASASMGSPRESGAELPTGSYLGTTYPCACNQVSMF